MKFYLKWNLFPNRENYNWLSKDYLVQQELLKKVEESTVCNLNFMFWSFPKKSCLETGQNQWMEDESIYSTHDCYDWAIFQIQGGIGLWNRLCKDIQASSP